MPLDYSDEGMKMEKAIRDNFLNYLMEVQGFKTDALGDDAELKKYDRLFQEAMDDDFNTPQALTVLHEMIHFARKTNQHSMRLAAAEKLKKFCAVFGLSFTDARLDPSLDHLTKEVNDLIRKRYLAKQQGDFKQADAIRLEIMNKYHLELIDEKDGPTHWRAKKQ
jgi:cysteinyl-tRNA synthetase